MGLGDKVSGRVKQAAGDLLGDEGTRQQGKDEERKGEAKEELAREDQRAEQAQARADAQADRAQERADAQAERADERAEEVDRLERRT